MQIKKTHITYFRIEVVQNISYYPFRLGFKKRVDQMKKPKMKGHSKENMA
jgi:hypothetical protein